jgi:hypothetical protein
MIAWTRVETIGRCLPLESGKFCTLFYTQCWHRLPHALAQSAGSAPDLYDTGLARVCDPHRQPHRSKSAFAKRPNQQIGSSSSLPCANRRATAPGPRHYGALRPPAAITRCPHMGLQKESPATQSIGDPPPPRYTPGRALTKNLTVDQVRVRLDHPIGGRDRGESPLVGAELTFKSIGWEPDRHRGRQHPGNPSALRHKICRNGFVYDMYMSWRHGSGRFGTSPRLRRTDG